MFALTSDMFVVKDGVVFLHSVLAEKFYETEALCMAAAEGVLSYFESAPDMPENVIALTAGCTKLVGM